MAGSESGQATLGPVHPEEGSSPGSSRRERRDVALGVHTGTHISSRHLWVSHMGVGSDSQECRDRLIVLGAEGRTLRSSRLCGTLVTWLT